MPLSWYPPVAPTQTSKQTDKASLSQVEYGRQPARSFKGRGKYAANETMPFNQWTKLLSDAQMTQQAQNRIAATRQLFY